jgi:hypothetical protein
MVPFQAWRPGFLAHVERMRQFVDHDRRSQAKPRRVRTSSTTATTAASSPPIGPTVRC